MAAVDVYTNINEVHRDKIVTLSTIYERGWGNAVHSYKYICIENVTKKIYETMKASIVSCPNFRGLKYKLNIYGPNIRIALDRLKTAINVGVSANISCIIPSSSYKQNLFLIPFVYDNRNYFAISNKVKETKALFKEKMSVSFQAYKRITLVSIHDKHEFYMFKNNSHFILVPLLTTRARNTLTDKLILSKIFPISQETAKDCINKMGCYHEKLVGLVKNVRV